MSEHDVASEIRMERMVHKGSFLILEGNQDVKRFNPFLDNNSCSIVCTHSVSKAIKTCQLLNQRNFDGFLTVVDSDFKRLYSSNVDCKNLHHSQFHDLDIDWLTPKILEKYLNEVADKAKLSLHGGSQEIIDLVLNELKPISCARLLNHEGIFNFKVNNVEAGDIVFSSTDLIKSYADELIRLGNIHVNQRNFVENEIRSKCQQNLDLMQITNGHDFFSALGALLKSSIGNRKNQQAWGKEIGLHLRLATEKEDFNNFYITSLIRNWEESNSLKILN